MTLPTVAARAVGAGPTTRVLNQVMTIAHAPDPVVVAGEAAAMMTNKTKVDRDREAAVVRNHETNLGKTLRAAPVAIRTLRAETLADVHDEAAVIGSAMIKNETTTIVIASVMTEIVHPESRK